MMTHLYIDVETLPSSELTPEDCKSLVKVGVRKGEKAEAYRTEHAEEAWKKTALDVMRATVLCVGVAVDDGPVSVIWEETERETLDKLASVLKGAVAAKGALKVVAHNGCRFDLPLLCKRAAKYATHDGDLAQMCRFLWLQKPWGAPHVVDTLVSWQGPDNRSRGSLDALCEHLGIERDNPITGADVLDRFRAGDTDAIEAHLRDDVRVLRLVHQRLQLLGMA